MFYLLKPNYNFIYLLLGLFEIIRKEEENDISYNAASY